MELKEILSHAEAVQFLLYSIQHGKQTRTALKKALPEDVPTDALLDAMTDFGFLCRDGKQFRLNQERLEQLRQFLQLYTAVSMDLMLAGNVTHAVRIFIVFVWVPP